MLPGQKGCAEEQGTGKTHTSPRLFRLSVASSSVGGLGCSFFAPNMRFMANG